MTAQVHRWRYARPTAVHTPPRLGPEVCPPLAFAGDAFAGARVAGAHLSGRIAAEAILRYTEPSASQVSHSFAAATLSSAGSSAASCIRPWTLCQ